MKNTNLKMKLFLGEMFMIFLIFVFVACFSACGDDAKKFDQTTPPYVVTSVPGADIPAGVVLKDSKGKLIIFPWYSDFARSIKNSRRTGDTL